jgi:transcriptional regulator GlxA family with amidase domain
MGAETAQAGFGAGLVIDRLGDALFIQALRAFCGDGRATTPGWVAGLADKRLERAIRAVHADLARPWTVEAMAQVAGASRSSFAARFKAVVGEAPLDYVTGWRIYRARVLLGSTDDSLARIADLVGYESEVSLSRAFRRSQGAPPGQWRRQAQARARDLEAAAMAPAHAEAV